MVVNLSLFCQVVVAVSFLASLVITWDWRNAILESLLALVAGFLGLVVIARQQRARQERLFTVIEQRIRRLRQSEWQMRRILEATGLEQRRVENHIRLMQGELSKLYSKIAVQRDYKEKLQQDVMLLEKYQQQGQESERVWQQRIEHLDRQRLNLETLVRSLNDKKRQVETEVAQLEQDVEVMQEIKLQLEAQLANLEGKIAEIEQPQIELNQQLAAQPRGTTPLPAEWQAFAQRLTNTEIAILRAIAEQNNPAALLRQIAAERITMPQLLIDEINELALETIDDLIIEPGDPPTIPEPEYLLYIRQIIISYPQS
jgi:chromosome segregation ATPase